MQQIFFLFLYRLGLSFLTLSLQSATGILLPFWTALPGSFQASSLSCLLPQAHRSFCCLVRLHIPINVSIRSLCSQKFVLGSLFCHIAHPPHCGQTNEKINQYLKLFLLEYFCHKSF